jgi:hypothetical protein
MQKGSSRVHVLRLSSQYNQIINEDIWLIHVTPDGSKYQELRIVCKHRSLELPLGHKMILIKLFQRMLVTFKFSTML